MSDVINPEASTPPHDLLEKMIVSTAGSEKYSPAIIRHIFIGRDLILMTDNNSSVWDMQFKPRDILRMKPDMDIQPGDIAIFAATMLKFLDWSDKFSDFSPRFTRPTVLEGTDYEPMSKLIQGILGDHLGETVHLTGDPADPSKFAYRIDLQKLRASEEVMTRLRDTIAKSPRNLVAYFHERKFGLQAKA